MTMTLQTFSVTNAQYLTVIVLIVEMLKTKRTMTCGPVSSVEMEELGLRMNVFGQE